MMEGEGARIGGAAYQFRGPWEQNATLAEDVLVVPR
jgi:hypothetical protein